MPPQTRRAVAGDLDHLVGLLQQMSLESPREQPGEPLLPAYRDAFAHIDADSNHHLLVAEEDGVVYGTATLWVITNLSHMGRPKGIIDNVVVDSTVRSKGYGALLINRCIEIARESGCYDVALTSNKVRSDAHRFYRRLGFEQCSEGFRVTF